MPDDEKPRVMSDAEKLAMLEKKFALLKELYEELFKNLRGWAYVYEFEEGGAWEGSKNACVEIVRFLINVDCPDVGLAPFMAIANGFKELQETGRMPHLFSLDRSVSQKDRSYQHDHHKTWLAALLEVLFKQGDSLKASAQSIARGANSWKEFEKKKLTARTIIGWRSDLLASPAAERKLYELLSDHLAGLPDPRARVEEFLKGGLPGVPRK